MRTAIRWTWAAMLLLCMTPAFAQRAEGSRARAQGVYEAEVLVRSQTDGERDGGFARALSQVLSNLSGERNPGARPGVGQELRRAKEYVAGYDYRQDEGVSASGAPSFDTLLVVRFKPEMVDELIKMAGVPVWPTPRPKPVLWLAIDDGSGPRLVGLQQNNAARSILDRAKARGYSLGLPAGNAAEQAAAGAIWRGDTAAVARISRAYSPPMQLVGKLYRAGAGWKADWIFVDNGRVLARTSTGDGDARRAMSGGADMAADALTRKYARATVPDSPPGDFVVTISGIAGAGEYLRLIGWLEGHPLVGRIVPVSAEGGSVVLQLALRSGLPGFRRSLERDGVIVAVGDDADFVLR
ncbi:DUF2066 domain-containing protein [Lysobacter pythonis]|uniref:DUF2066 domain-containing protein n=1 Tax=Solilutibacter pythonis TaxID=2483112 RepID=A0A3M2I7G4_9GAMM|nr:DUF2066 domain-containing protein [Lysobacter pythonis]RMH94224.1 DUF2066 domain-containing protein [Lysobacter pythonis]